jgi:hypothetical protein
MYAAIGSYLLIALIMFIAAFRSNKKKIDEIKDKMDGRVLGDGTIREEDLGIFYCEQPFYDVYKNYN